MLDLPAGAVAASVRGGVMTRDFTSRSLVSGVASETALSRDSGSVEGSLDVPITAKGTYQPTYLNPLGRIVSVSFRKVF